MTVPELLVHIAHGSDWEAATRTGAYAPPMLAEDGFIHLSKPEQAHLPANALYSDTPGLVLLWIDPALVGGEIRYEPAEPGSDEVFPHLYAPLEVSAVVDGCALDPWKPGGFELPSQPGREWYVLNMRDAEWRHADGRGAVCVVADDFEGRRRPSAQLGVNPFVLQPGEAQSMYHWEADQEGFLVVAGEALLVVEGEERRLRAWDFVHCPPYTKHVIVGAGTGPCLVIAVGSRAHDGHPESLGFTVDEVAKRFGASVEEDTLDGGVAYARVPPRRPTSYREGWLPD